MRRRRPIQGSQVFTWSTKGDQESRNDAFKKGAASEDVAAAVQEDTGQEFPLGMNSKPPTTRIGTPPERQPHPATEMSLVSHPAARTAEITNQHQNHRHARQPSDSHRPGPRPGVQIPRTIEANSEPRATTTARGNDVDIVHGPLAPEQRAPAPMAATIARSGRSKQPTATMAADHGSAAGTAANSHHGCRRPPSRRRRGLARAQDPCPGPRRRGGRQIPPAAALPEAFIDLPSRSKTSTATRPKRRRQTWRTTAQAAAGSQRPSGSRPLLAGNARGGGLAAANHQGRPQATRSRHAVAERPRRRALRAAPRSPRPQQPAPPPPRAGERKGPAAADAARA